MALPVQNPLVHLPAAAVGMVVVDDGVIVDQLFAAPEVEAVQERLDIFIAQAGPEVVAGNRATHGQRE